MRSRRWFGAMAVGACLSLPIVAGAVPDGVPTMPAEQRFEFTGAPDQFQVPVGVEEISVVACGAEGGMHPDVPDFGIIGAPGGLGGEVRSRLVVEPSERLVVNVGGAGDGDGGYNGGGVTSVAFGSEAGGGGASDVRRGGSALRDRVVVAAGGGGGGAGSEFVFPTSAFLRELFGGVGGGVVGGDAVGSEGGRGATATSGGAAGAGNFGRGVAGVLGQGGRGADGAGGGGGGLYGGGGGSVALGYGGGGGGGSSLGDSTTPGVCEGDGSVTISFEQPQAVRPFGALVTEGDSGSTIVDVPLFLLFPVDEEVSIDWSTQPGGSRGLATAGSDFVAASGRVTFAPGTTRATVPVEVLADTDDEPDLLWGEWLVIEFSNPSSNALLDTNPFFGAGLVIIFDDDAAAVG